MKTIDPMTWGVNISSAGFVCGGCDAVLIYRYGILPTSISLILGAVIDHLPICSRAIEIIETYTELNESNKLTHDETTHALTFKMPACSKHFFKGHKWWCRKCDEETERQFKDSVYEMWKLQGAEDRIVKE